MNRGSSRDLRSQRMAGLILLLFLLSPIARCQGISAADNRAADEQEVRLVVIRNQMEEWIQGGDKSEAEAKDATEKCIAKELNFRVFFVSMNGKDPNDGFMERLRDIPRIVKKVSSSEISKSERMPVLDRATRQRGIIFSANKVRWLSKDSVEVEGGYHCDGLCGAGITFKLLRENGKWILKSARMNWIS